MIYDGMVILQQVDATKLATFGDLSDSIISRITSRGVGCTYFVTDQYCKNSIESYERNCRAQSGIVRIKIERRNQRLPK